MEPPSREAVYESVYALFNNTDSSTKEKASRWLEQLQKSVYSWTIADELLQEKRDLHSCYFAAQTMRNKIQNSFHELPSSAHESLKNSLLVHLSQVTDETDPLIVTQLGLAIADLSLLMAAWENPVYDLMERFSKESSTIWPLITVLTLIPEEVDSRYLRLGRNRREEVLMKLQANSHSVSMFLVSMMQNFSHSATMMEKVIKCITSWISIQAIFISELADNLVINNCFQFLSNPDTDAKLHDISTDCLCTLLTCLECNTMKYEYGAPHMQIFNNVLALENAYLMSVASENIDKAINYCRVFTHLGEAFVDVIVKTPDEKPPHYSIKSFDMALNCVGHYDYEVAEITFNLWYRLSEKLYEHYHMAETVPQRYRPYIERLIMALFRHVQMDTDHEGLLIDGGSFCDFRRKVTELIKDVAFIIGSINVFRQMFLKLQEPNVTWEETEAALFIMENVARNIIPDEETVAPRVVEAILNLPETTHLSVRYTSIMLLSELSDWIQAHPESIEPILNFLLFALQQKNDISAAAATALTSICTACRSHMTRHLQGLIQIVQCLDSLSITNDAAIELLKGVSIIISELPKAAVAQPFQEICSFQLVPLCALIETDIKAVRNQRSDPCFWIDRLAAIWKHSNPNCSSLETHPFSEVFTNTWPILSNVVKKYASDVRIMERTCRCLRYALRTLRKQAAPLLQPMVELIVNVYAIHPHSCFLYMGSILVDEFDRVNDICTQGLLNMLEAFIEPTFNMLQVEHGLKNHPDTVDDFFRLCSRFIQRSALPFLQSPAVTPIIQCALLACTLDHRDANQSVMKFFCNLLSCGRSDNNAQTRELVEHIVLVNGESLVMNLIHASVFCLHSYMLSDVADVIVELKEVKSANINQHLRSALEALPKKNSGGCVTATPAQLDLFHSAVMGSNTVSGVTLALKDFTRLFR